MAFEIKKEDFRERAPRRFGNARFQREKTPFRQAFEEVLFKLEIGEMFEFHTSDSHFRSHKGMYQEIRRWMMGYRNPEYKKYEFIRDRVFRCRYFDRGRFNPETGELDEGLRVYRVSGEQKYDRKRKLGKVAKPSELPKDADSIYDEHRMLEEDDEIDDDIWDDDNYTIDNEGSIGHFKDE